MRTQAITRECIRSRISIRLGLPLPQHSSRWASAALSSLPTVFPAATLLLDEKSITAHWAGMLAEVSCFQPRRCRPLLHIPPITPCMCRQALLCVGTAEWMQRGAIRGGRLPMPFTIRPGIMAPLNPRAISSSEADSSAMQIPLELAHCLFQTLRQEITAGTWLPTWM